LLVSALVSYIIISSFDAGAAPKLVVPFISRPTLTSPVVGATIMPNSSLVVEAATVSIGGCVSVGVTQDPSPRRKVVAEPPAGT